MCHRATIIMLFRPFQKVRIDGMVEELPRTICKKAAREIIRIAHRYQQELGYSSCTLTFCHYVFLACQTFLLEQPAEEENLNRGLRVLAGAKDLWPAGALGLFALPMLSQKWDVELSEETRAIPKVLTDAERSLMASTAWASAREEEVKVDTSEFLDYWEKAFADM